VASKFGGRVKLGRLLADELEGLQSPDNLIEDTVLAELVKERMRYAQEYGDNPDLPNDMLDTQLKNIYLGDGILNKAAPVEHIDIPEDPEVDRIVDEANLADKSIFSGGPKKKAPPKDKLDTKLEDAEKAEKRAAAKKKKEAKIRDYVVKLLLKQDNELTDEQQAVLGEDPDNPIEGLSDVVKWDARVDKGIRKDQIKRDKEGGKHAKDALARKVIAYADDPEQFEKTWYKDNPVYAKRRLPDGKLEKREIIFDEDNPDPDLEGVDLVKYADAMNEKFPPVSSGFIEYDYGPPTKSGDTKHPADLLRAAATGKEFTHPEKLEFPEVAASGIDPANNRLGMVRRMLFGELSDDELAYLMDLMDKDQQFSSGGYVDNKAFRFLQKQYGTNHPVLSDKRFKKQYVGRLATAIRRAI
jgi:hypothetical protein